MHENLGTHIVLAAFGPSLSVQRHPGTKETDGGGGTIPAKDRWRGGLYESSDRADDCSEPTLCPG